MKTVLSQHAISFTVFITVLRGELILLYIMHAKSNIIYLTGFMGSGKTTIGHILANKIGWDFLDLDRLIEEETGKKISEIFSIHGEAYFRQLETDYVRKVSGYQKYIISLGGGTIAFNDNLQILKSSGRIVYLKTSPEKVYARLRFKTDRPVLKMQEEKEDRTKVIDHITTLMQKREVFYSQADIVFRTDNLPMGKAVDLLAKQIERYI